MALDYTNIHRDKEQEYGTKVGNYGRLLANLYSDRAHFIFELLQNAEDVAVMRKILLQLNAVARRGTPWAPQAG